MNAIRPAIHVSLQFAICNLQFAILGSCGSPPPPPPPAAQHLLFLSIDTLRADHLGAYGHPRPSSPTIDALAAAGVRFQRAYATSSSTSPSFASFWTSRYPSEHGVLANRFGPLPESETLLAEILRDAGFVTGAFVANRLLLPLSGIAQGIDHYQVIDDEAELTREAAAWIEEHFAGSERVFLWVHYLQPHAPYDPPPGYAELVGAGVTDVSWDGSQNALDRIFIDKIQLAPEELAHIEALYDGCIRFVDDQVALLLQALDRAGAAGRTLVLFAGDHGEDLYDHNAYFYHANSVYGSSLRIPLVFRLPGKLPAGHVYEGLVSGVDILPTALGFLGVRPVGPLHGVDLSRALLRGERIARPLVFSEWEDAIVTVQGTEWSFVHNPSGTHPNRRPQEGAYPVAERELYDLERDPDEQENLAASHPDVVRRFQEAIGRWRGSLARRGEPLSTFMDARKEAAMRQLGYK